MSTFLKYIVIFFLIVSGNFAFATESFSEEEKNEILQEIAPNNPSQIILDLIEEDEQKLSLEEKLKIIVETTQEINKNIEGEKLNEDFTEEIRKYFPEDTTKELYEKQKAIRISMRLYRYFSGLYDEIKAKLLVPRDPPLIVDDDDYDTGYKAPYIEAPEGQSIIVQDFKKVLSYGSNPKDIEAMSAKRKRDLENKKDKSRMDELWITLSKVDWKNTLFGTVPTESPFTGNLGSGPWYRTDNVKVKILAAISKVDDRNQIDMIFNFRINNNHFFMASTLDNNPYIKIDFSNSENFKSTKIFYPNPTKIDIGNDDRILGYGGNFSIPFTVFIEDNQKDLILNPVLTFSLCNSEIECEDIELKPTLTLEHGEGFSSQYNNYINLVKNNVPKAENENLKILSVVATELSNDEKILRIIFENDYTLSSFDVFIESPDNIEFYRPRVAIDGKKIVVRAVLKDQSLDIVGKEFLITGIINKFYSIRGLYEATDKSFFDVMNEKLSLALIVLAIIGGFILNFMPCVFPVLSIKLMSLNKVGARKISEVKKSFYFTIFGILITFFILALILCFIKYLGYSIGWGMQFQNPVFLICMIFIISLFIGYIFGIQKVTTPKWLNKLIFKTQGEDNLLYFMTGVLVVIMATPCTAPYLGTTIGFALAGSYVDIMVILMSVAVGLSLPYILFVAFPNLAIYVPKPGNWMNKLNTIMVIMLILTLFWLISIYYAQTSLGAAFRMFLYSLCFLFILWFRYLVNMEIDISIETLQERKKLKRKFNTIAATLIVLIFSGAVFDGVYNFVKKREEISQVRENTIDMNLINKYVKEGKIVVINVQADWCLTCLYNDLTVFSNIYVQRLVQKENIEIINIDWTNYNKDVLNFMEKYGRKGLPFYIVYSQKVPDGMVLPEILNDLEFTKIINSISDN